MKVRIFLDDRAPKVPPKELAELVMEAGMKVGATKADFGIVVGGDGRFSRYGRTEDIPLLFIGVRSKSPTGSKAYLAQANYGELPAVLKKIVKGEYTVEEYPRLAVYIGGKKAGEVFTDTYLERGGESTCIRYRVKVGGKAESFEEEAIGDGVIVSTRAGSTGYYSYPDRVKGDWMDPNAFARIGTGEVGICHIAPTYTERAGTKSHPLRYTVPWGSKIRLSLFRRADARLYGTSDNRGGFRIGIQDEITIVPAKKSTKLVTLPGI
jgi:hypothetical protein